MVRKSGKWKCLSFVKNVARLSHTPSQAGQMLWNLLLVMIFSTRGPAIFCWQRAWAYSWMTHSRTANHSETKQSWQIRLNYQTIEWYAKNIGLVLLKDSKHRACWLTWNGLKQVEMWCQCLAKIGDKLIGCCAFVPKSIEDVLPMIPSWIVISSILQW